MKINIEDIKTVKKLLEKIPYQPMAENAKLFFEIDCGKVVDDGTFVMEVKDRESGAGALTRPGLILTMQCDEKHKEVHTLVDLAYAVIDYAPKFNLSAYLDIMDARINKKQEQLLTNLDVYLVKKDYILTTFEI